MKKLILILFIFTLCSCKYNKEYFKKESTNILKYDKNTFEYGDLIKLKDIFKNENIEFINEYLDTSTLGNNTLKVNYWLDNNLYEETYSYEIVDTTKPIVYLSNTYYVEKDSEEFESKIICADNHDKKPKCFIEGTYDLTIEGKYPLVYKAIDSSKNETNINFTLIVYEPKSPSTKNSSSEKDYIENIIQKYKSNETLIGIDVSKWQGDINWEKVKNSGVEFAIIRLGYQLGYESQYELDPYFIQNIEGALENDIKVGIYFYSYATDAKEAEKQANYVIDNIKNYKIEMPIAFDWENFKNWNELEISTYDLRNTSFTFQQVLKEAGYTPVQYGSKNYLNTFWLPIKFDTWVAHYGVEETSYTEDYIMWQLSNTGKVDGINGNVDLDIYYLQ